MKNGRFRGRNIGRGRERERECGAERDRMIGIQSYTNAVGQMKQTNVSKHGKHTGK